MARTRKPTGESRPKTGDQFIAMAKSRGAVVEDKGGKFIKVSTRKGATYITPGDETLDPRTRKNLRHWFRLLGLLMLAGMVTYPLWIQPIRNMMWVAGH